MIQVLLVFLAEMVNLEVLVLLGSLAPLEFVKVVVARVLVRTILLSMTPNLDIMMANLEVVVRWVECLEPLDPLDPPAHLVNLVNKEVMDIKDLLVNLDRLALQDPLVL